MNKIVVFLALQIVLMAMGGVVSIKVGKMDDLILEEGREGGWLNCTWDMEGAKLITVKWFAGTAEIYRYYPAGGPLGEEQIFHHPHLVVDERLSSRGKVRVHDAWLAATGPMRCEVTGDGPFFDTQNTVLNLLVVSKPKDGPIIKGALPFYSIEDWANLECISPPAFPPANLTFRINGKPVIASPDTRIRVGRKNYNLAIYHEAHNTSLNLPTYHATHNTSDSEGIRKQSTQSQIQLRLRHHRRSNSVIKVECIASVQYSWYNWSAKTGIFLGTHGRNHYPYQLDMSGAPGALGLMHGGLLLTGFLAWRIL